jgi:hypothetical protein
MKSDYPGHSFPGGTPGEVQSNVIKSIFNFPGRYFVFLLSFSIAITVIGCNFVGIMDSTRNQESHSFSLNTIVHVLRAFNISVNLDYEKRFIKIPRVQEKRKIFTINKLKFECNIFWFHAYISLWILKCWWWEKYV